MYDGEDVPENYVSQVSVQIPYDMTVSFYEDDDDVGGLPLRGAGLEPADLHDRSGALGHEGPLEREGDVARARGVNVDADDDPLVPPAQGASSRGEDLEYAAGGDLLSRHVRPPLRAGPGQGRRKPYATFWRWCHTDCTTPTAASCVTMEDEP